MPIISSIEQMAIERGIERGLEQGLERGLEQGLERGIQLGKQEGIQQVARNLLARGMDPQQLAMVTELTLEQIQQLQLNLNDGDDRPLDLGEKH